MYIICLHVYVYKHFIHTQSRWHCGSLELSVGSMFFSAVCIFPCQCQYIKLQYYLLYTVFKTHIVGTLKVCNLSYMSHVPFNCCSRNDYRNFPFGCVWCVSQIWGPKAIIFNPSRNLWNKFWKKIRFVAESPYSQRFLNFSFGSPSTLGWSCHLRSFPWPRQCFLRGKVWELSLNRWR